MATSVSLSSADQDLIVAFAGCSLDESPGSNWVQANGSLPDYICRIAKAVRKTGKTTSEAIAIAVSRVKMWASGKGVDKDTQAKAAAAVAEWEKLKAKAKAKGAAKDVKASAVDFPVDDKALLTLIALTPRCHMTALDKVLLSIPRSDSGR